MEDKIIDDIKKKYNLGETGIFPLGDKISPSDQGELKSALVRKGDNILLVFGKPVEWVSLTRESARALGKQLINMSNEL